MSTAVDAGDSSSPSSSSLPSSPWRRVERFVDDDTTARRAMWVLWPVGVLILIWFGRDHWFLADDWAFLITREQIREVNGWDSMLMTPQDGHWMLWPLLVFRVLRNLFGVGSYMPYLVVLWASHVAVVALARVWMVRLGASAWMTTLMTTLLLVFGAGWENLFFAVQIVYNFSIVAFLGHTLLVDHDGPVDRRDWIGAGVSLIGVSSSGFGPFFAFGVALMLALRRRWTALAVAVVPQALALGWWWLTWGDDPAGDREGTAGLEFITRFTAEGMASTYGSLGGARLLAGAAAVLSLGIVVWKGTSWRDRTVMITMLVTAGVMYAGIGARREVFGLSAATWSRYQYVAAMLVAPTLAVALDQAKRFAPWGRWVPRVLLVLVIARNVHWMDQRGGAWAAISNNDRRVMSLVAGSDLLAKADPARSISLDSPDVRVGELDLLIDDGAITPTPPSTPEEQALVAELLGVAP